MAGFIGAGKMAQALCRGFLSSGEFSTLEHCTTKKDEADTRLNNIAVIKHERNIETCK